MQPDTWRLVKNCRMGPARLMACMVGPALVALLLSVPFLRLGYGWITALALLQALVVTAAALCFAVHAIDGEVLTLVDGRLHMVQRNGWQVQHHAWPAAAVRVLPRQAGQRGLVLLADGRAHEVGRHRSPPELDRVAQQLRHALTPGHASPG